MGKNKNKKNSNKVSSTVHIAVAGLSIQQVPKEDASQSKSSKRNKKHKKEINQDVAIKSGSGAGQVLNLIGEADNDKELNKPNDQCESNDVTTSAGVGIFSQERDSIDTHKEVCEKFEADSKNEHESKKNRGEEISLDNNQKDDWVTSHIGHVFPSRSTDIENLKEKESNKYGRRQRRNSHSTSRDRETYKKRYDERDKGYNMNKQPFDGRKIGKQKPTNADSKTYPTYAKNHSDNFKETGINKKQHNYTEGSDDSKLNVPNKSLKSSHIQTLRNVVVDKDFHSWLPENNNKFNCVIEVEGDLFDAREESCLAHCVAEDMSMGSGIAVLFRQRFKKVADLLNQRQKAGGLAVLEDKNRFIYYLVTKKKSAGKPTLATLWASLNKLKNHMVENNATSLAIPRIGCGLDRLEWCEVKSMIEYLFSKTDIKVTVYNLSNQSELEDSSPSLPLRVRNCKVVHENYSLLEIGEYTIIVYLCSEEGENTDQIKALDKKFNILSSYNNATKTLGSVIRYDKKNYILYGFVVKRKPDDEIDFISFQKCINQLNSKNEKDLFEYVAIEEFYDPQDDILFDKIINLMRNGLKYVHVYVCKPHFED